MTNQGSYVPPRYVPLEQSDIEAEAAPTSEVQIVCQPPSDGPIQWSSGVCACFDDMPSCCIGLFCPCYLFGKNAVFLGSSTLMGSCTTYFILWALINTVSCFLTDGIWLGLPGCFVSCYACNYRSALRTKYNLEEAPCGDFATHFFCHLCAVCQEYRELRERSNDARASDLTLAAVSAPPVQTMDPFPEQ